MGKKIRKSSQVSGEDSDRVLFEEWFEKNKHNYSSQEELKEAAERFAYELGFKRGYKRAESHKNN